MVNGEWKSVHEGLMGLAGRRAAMDAEEVRWIRRALEVEVWVPFGMVTIVDYLERVVGYAPRTAMDRVRVTIELTHLQKMEAALDRGEVGYSVVREVVRVANVESESAWLSAVEGKSVKEVEDMTRGLEKGAMPGDPPVPSLMKRKIVLEVSPEVFARFQQACTEVSDEVGHRLEREEVFALAIESLLADGDADDAPRSQVAVTVCEECKQGWQHGGGEAISIGDGAVELAMCDAMQIGSIDGHVVERGSATVTPAIRRFVKHRDGGRCRVPGCRSKKHLDIHHIIHQATGESTNDPRYLVLMCHSCHVAHHEQRILVTGTSDDLVVTRPALDEFTAHVSTNPSHRHDRFDFGNHAPAPTSPPTHALIT